LSGNISAEIHGMLTQPLSAKEVREIRAALLRHKVILLRNQHLTQVQLRAECRHTMLRHSALRAATPQVDEASGTNPGSRTRHVAAASVKRRVQGNEGLGFPWHSLHEPGPAVPAEQQIILTAELLRLDMTAVWQSDYRSSRDVEPGLHGAVPAERDPHSRVRTKQRSLADAHPVLAASGERPHR